MGVKIAQSILEADYYQISNLTSIQVMLMLHGNDIHKALQPAIQCVDPADYLCSGYAQQELAKEDKGDG